MKLRGLWNRSVWGAVLLAAGAAAEPASTEFFEKNIRPVLVDHCYECHGGDPTKIKGGLNLTYRDGMLQGAGTSLCAAFTRAGRCLADARSVPTARSPALNY